MAGENFSQVHLLQCPLFLGTIGLESLELDFDVVSVFSEFVFFLVVEEVVLGELEVFLRENDWVLGELVLELPMIGLKMSFKGF